MTWVGCEEAAALTIVGPSQPPQPQPQPLSLSNPTQGTLLHMHSCHSGTSFCRLGTRYIACMNPQKEVSAVFLPLEKFFWVDR